MGCLTPQEMALKIGMASVCIFLRSRAQSIHGLGDSNLYTEKHCSTLCERYTYKSYFISKSIYLSNKDDNIQKKQSTKKSWMGIHTSRFKENLLNQGKIYGRK